MENKITVKEFIEKYNGDVEILKVRTYIPITEKRVVIEELIKRIIVEDGLVTTYDSIAKLMISTLAAICLYTNLDATTAEDYDTLCETNLLFKIYERINSEGDYVTFQDMFDLRFRDFVRTANSTTGIINKIFLTLKDALENFDTEELSNLLKMANML